MCLKVSLLFLTLLYASKAAVLLWSTNNLEISPLKAFTDTSLEDLIQKLGYPEVTVYKSTSALLPQFEGLLDGYYTAYNPNGEISTENATEIAEQDDLTLLVSKQRLDLSRNDNVLSVLILPTRRKRETGTGSSTTEIVPTTTQGPVLYRANSNKDIYSLLYSSQPLVIRNITANTTVEVGESRSVTVDQKNNYTRLYIKVQEENNVDQLMLQFFFVRENSYWTLTTAKVGSTSHINSTVSLSISDSDTFSVPMRFSYHCNGETVFSDAAKTIELVIYDMQAQMESKDGRFSDAYDCVDFTTAPIWSGIFVTSLLAVGLMVALTALSEIKTMDKFDNQKTKQLAVTVAE